MTIEHLDLRKFTRNSEQIVSTISVVDETGVQHPWIMCGEVEIKPPHSRTGTITLAAYMDNATDREHDSAYAFMFELFRLDFKYISSGLSWFEGIISVPTNRFDMDKFRVPAPGVDLFEGSKECNSKYCDGRKHRIVDYLPKPNHELWKRLGGHSITLVTGAADNFNLEK